MMIPLQALQNLIDSGRSPELITVTVCHPCSEISGRGAVRAGQEERIEMRVFDGAMSKQAALAKGPKCVVTGQADIPEVSDLESCNMPIKQLEDLANAKAGRIVLGAHAINILTSRPENTNTRLASHVGAVKISHAAQQTAQVIHV